MTKEEYDSLNMTGDELELRQMLAFAYSGHHLYCDDGELQDNRWPLIDFMRDSVQEIHNKITERGILAYQAMLKGETTEILDDIENADDFVRWTRREN